MKRSKVTVKFERLKLLERTMKIKDNSIANAFNYEFVPKYLRIMKAGMSPIEKKGFFALYTVPYILFKRQIQKANIPNLFLSGTFYASFKAFFQGDELRLGLAPDTDAKIKAYMKAHNKGLNHQPERRWLPIEGEKFNSSLTQVIKRIFKKKLSDILKK